MEAVGFLTGNMRFATCRPEKPIENFQAIFGILNYVDKTYKYIKVGSDRFTGGTATQW